jgi:hypothetical protein
MEPAGTLKFTAVKFNVVVCLFVVPYVADFITYNRWVWRRNKNLRKTAVSLKSGAVFL